MSRKIVCGVLVCLSLCGWVVGEDLYWDVNLVDPAEQPGNGVWDLVTANWWDGANNVAYTDANDAVFFTAGDGSPYTVTLAQDVQIGSDTANDALVKFDPGSDCTIAGPYTISITTDPAINIKDAIATIDVDIERTISDAGIRVNDNSYLSISGDVSVPSDGDPGSTDDLVLGSKGYRQNFSTIDITGYYSHVSDSGRTYIEGYDPDREEQGSPYRADVEVVFGDGEIDVSKDGQGLWMLSGSRVILDGRLECDFIALEYNLGANGIPRPELRGSAAKTGTLALKTADYNAVNRLGNKGYERIFIANNRGNNGGFVYTSDLNLEIDVTGLDYSDPNHSLYKLAANKAQRWYGTFNSISVVEPAGVVGTVVTFTPDTFQDPNECCGTDATHYFYVETADFDQNGCVDFADFAELADDWLAPCGGHLDEKLTGGDWQEPRNDWCSGADFNHSGTVDIDDLNLFVAKWLLGCGS